MRSFWYLLFLGLSCWSDCAADGSGYFMYADFWCNVLPTERQQVEYLIDWYFNKEYTMQYNSTAGGWTGFTPAGLITASAFNEDKHDVLQRKVERQLICVDHVAIMLKVIEENVVEPSVTLVETAGPGPNTTLVCSAYDFYPKLIRVSWLRDGQEVTSGVTSSDTLTNGDWTYQVHSHLEFRPRGPDRVSCTVEHLSLREPKVLHWDSSLKRSEVGFLVGGVCALLLGALFLSLGLIKYWRTYLNLI